MPVLFILVDRVWLVGRVVGVSPLPMPTLVPPVVMPARTAETRAASTEQRHPLPLPKVIAARQRSTVYGFTAVDTHGRLADRRVMAALGWRPGTTISVQLADESIMVADVADGRHAVGREGRVHLYAGVRLAAGIRPGDRVLLAAEPDDGMLTINPVARLEAMFNALRGREGDAA